jgi:hypothetical protein
MRRKGTTIAAALLAIAALLALAPRAAAGIYRAVQCSPELGAGHADAVFTRNTIRYAGRADCDEDGLTLTHEPGSNRTRAGRFGAWTVTAPAGATILRAAARVTAAGADGHAPQMSVALPGGGRRFLPDVRGAAHTVSWVGDGARAMTARLVCANRRTCGPGEAARIRLRRVSLTLRDSSRPSLAPSGSLLQAGPRRGVQALGVASSDYGSGVRALIVEVNDKPVAVRALRCEFAGKIALRLRPCPASVDEAFAIATTSPHFRQGPNRLRVCALDHALRATANRRCAMRTARIDNLCPLSGVQGGTALHARFRGAGASRTTRSDRPATVTGRLTDPAGSPVAGAEVCVATRLPGRAEQVLATPPTDSNGAFRVRIPPGPSRAVRIAHWPSSDRALERHLTLRSRAIPRLRLRPRRALSNGERLRFRVRLPGPSRGGRRVRIEARSSGQWVEIARGRTSRSGRWHGRYRFRATTGTRRYAFRAVVPRQSGYPYERGRSRVARQTVTGA